jgi:hypothetical protein
LEHPASGTRRESVAGERQSSSKRRGPRIVKSLEILAEILDPEIVSFEPKSSATARRS